MSAIGQYSVGHEAAHSIHVVIEFLAMLSNDLIFVLAGAVGYRYNFSESIRRQDWIELILLYFLVHITRVAVIGMFYPMLKRSGYGCTLKEAGVMAFSGLRGAVGLAMAMMVESDTDHNPIHVEYR